MSADDPFAETTARLDDLMRDLEGPRWVSQQTMRDTFAAGRLQGIREAADKPDGFRWGRGALLRKKSGSWWEGRVVGFYSTEDTPIGYAVQLDRPHGPVQIFPETAFEEVPAIEALAKEAT